MARARELQAEANISTGWGKSRANYYDADTRDFEIESDEDVALGEETEGRRLQAEQAATLAEQVDQVDDLMAQVAEAEAEGTAQADAGKPAKKKAKTSERSDAELLQDMDADLDGIDMALDLDLDIAALTGSNDTSVSSKGQSRRLLVERIEKDLSAVSESERLELVLTSSPELLSLLDDFKANMEQLKTLLPVWEEMKADQEMEQDAWVSFWKKQNKKASLGVSEHAQATSETKTRN